MFVGYSSIYIASTLMHKYFEAKLDIDFFLGFLKKKIMRHIVSADERFPFLFH